MFIPEICGGVRQRTDVVENLAAEGKGVLVERLYWRGWWVPSGNRICTVTYWPGSDGFTSRS
jgi:hypothetical protein